MDHTVIYLAPPCFGDERHWCEDDAPVDCECDDGPHPWIKFAAEQVVQELRAENAHSRQLGREEGARMMQEAAAKLVADGFRCRTCGVVFDGTPAVGHPANGCERPNWDAATDEELSEAIRALDPAQVVKGDKP